MPALTGWLLLACVALETLTGCRGLPTRDERQARSEIQQVATLRAAGTAPDLTRLTNGSSLSNYIAFALVNQPSVAAAFYDWSASVERITQARSLPDPQFTFQMDIENIVTSVMPGLMGAIPWPEKLKVQARVASAQAQARRHSYEAEVLRTTFEVERTYYQLQLLEGKLRVSRETVQLLSELEELARARNEVGKVTLQDVLRAQIERDRLLANIANLKDSRGSLAAQFKAALGLGPEMPDPPLPSRFDSAPAFSPDLLLNTAAESNEEIKAVRSDIRAAEASLLLTQRANRPDFTLGLMADAQMTPPLYRPLGTISLPIWRDKIAAQIAEARANQHQVEARLSTTGSSLAAAFAEKSFLYREASRNVDLLQQQLLPKAHQSLEVARSGYLSGQIDFFNLVDAQRTLLNFELDQVEAVNQREVVLAELSLVARGMTPEPGTPGLSIPAMRGAQEPTMTRTTAGGM